MFEGLLSTLHHKCNAVLDAVPSKFTMSKKPHKRSKFQYVLVYESGTMEKKNILSLKHNVIQGTGTLLQFCISLFYTPTDILNVHNAFGRHIYLLSDLQFELSICLFPSEAQCQCPVGFLPQLRLICKYMTLLTFL